MAWPTDRPLVEAPAPDPEAEPAGFVVLVEPGDRIHFLDWGGPTEDAAAGEPGVLLVHGLSGTSWLWAPVARRLRRRRRTLAIDLRGHGLSDAPTAGYDRDALADDVVAVADGAGFLAGAGVVLAGHGFGASIATWAAAELGTACRGLVLVDGGWEDTRLATGLEPDEFLRTIEEPPEVLRSMRAYLTDRKGFDPSSWDADQERAARATVVETHAGKVVPVSRPHVIASMVEAMFDYRPLEAIAAVECPIVALIGMDDEEGTRVAALRRAQDSLAGVGRPPIRELRFPHDAHNLMRYRPAEVTAAILAVAGGATMSRPGPSQE
jgi:pimeloyl-ACP methyl ester carboxylesterase